MKILIELAGDPQTREVNQVPASGDSIVINNDKYQVTQVLWWDRREHGIDAQIFVRKWEDS